MMRQLNAFAPLCRAIFFTAEKNVFRQTGQYVKGSAHRIRVFAKDDLLSSAKDLHFSGPKPEFLWNPHCVTAS